MNNYKFDFAVSAIVSAKVVEEMVRKAVEDQTGKKVKSISMKVGTISRGFGPSESTEHVFDGCTVFFEPEAANGKTKTHESFDPSAR
jgi:hypothetical protein